MAINDEYSADHTFSGIWIVLGIVAVVMTLFITFVVVPANEDSHKRCEAAGGVLVGKYHDCIKKENVLSY